MSVIAHWKLNDNAASSTVLDDTGLYNGAYEAGAAGQNTSTGAGTGHSNVGGSLAFDGVDEHVEIADNTVFTPLSSPLSISAWVNMTDATNFTIVGKNIIAATTREWVLKTGPTDLLLYQIFDETNDKHITGFYNSTLVGFQGTWIHAAGVWNGNLSTPTFADIALYLNGESVAVSDADDAGFVSCRNTAAVIDIGHSSGVYSNGSIDNVIIFDHELTPDEVKVLYGGGHGTEIMADLDESRRIKRRPKWQI